MSSANLAGKPATTLIGIVPVLCESARRKPVSVRMCSRTTLLNCLIVRSTRSWASGGMSGSISRMARACKSSIKGISQIIPRYLCFRFRSSSPSRHFGPETLAWSPPRRSVRAVSSSVPQPLADRRLGVSRPDTLAFPAARQLEVAHEHVARIEWLALARIGQPSAAALAQLATLLRQGFGAQAVVVAVAWVVTPTRIEVHSYLRFESASEGAETGRGLAAVSKMSPKLG